jgi:cytoskeletal protein RodZ
MTEVSPKSSMAEGSARALSEAIRAGLDDKGIRSDQLVDRLRVSPDTVESLIAGKELQFMPEIYAKGHLRQIALELNLDPDEMYALYRSAHHKDVDTLDSLEMSVVPFRRLAVTAGLAGMGILAVLVAFLGG